MILDQIVEDKKKRLPEHKARISESRMRALAEEALAAEKNSAPDTQPGAHPTFYDNLKKPGLSIIGEFKKASPSLGQITSKIDLMERIEEYNASVDAISCLTEEDHFHGNVDYLKQIRAKSSLPILRKDFMIEEYQFYEAKAIGADAVLLITAILDDVQMHDFYQLARSLALDVLVETHDEAEIERAMKIDPRIIGVNNRNLKDFSITLETTKRLRPYVPKEKVFIAESGIVNDEDVAFLKACDVDGFLIGRAFMESENPKALAQRWKKIYADS
jgi:indole-3-glycerol phosphate synthase